MNCFLALSIPYWMVIGTFFQSCIGESCNCFDWWMNKNICAKASGIPHWSNVSASSFVSNLVMSAQISQSTNHSKERNPLGLKMYSRLNCSTTGTNSAVEAPFINLYKLWNATCPIVCSSFPIPSRNRAFKQLIVVDSTFEWLFNIPLYFSL